MWMRDPTGKLSSAALKFLFWFTFVVLICALLVIWRLVHRPPADITADFGNHTSTVSVPPYFLGTGGVGSTVSSQSGIDNITNVGLLGNRIWVKMNDIYANGDTPNYSLADAQLERGTQKGLSPIMVVDGTPPSLGSSSCSYPSDVNKWGRLASDVVAHFDHLHPGLNYEIWNEPDGAGWCTSGDLVQKYLALYMAAVPKMKQVAPTAKFGGPTLGAPGNSSATWIPALLSGSTAPYVDFVSIHIYISGSWALPGMTWEQLYSYTQADPNGIAFYYRQAEQLVRKGSQPDAAHTPIYIDEYNVNYSYQPNCCQNHEIYGPLWNVVAIADWINVGMQGSVPPARINYFMASDSKGYFCLEGAQATNYTNCEMPTEGQPYNAVYHPYPSLLAYQLFTGSQYLDIEQTGANIVTTPSAPNNLLTTAFYTSTADMMVIVNPTSTAVLGLRVKFTNLGLQPAHSQLFILNNNQLVSSELRLKPSRDGVEIKNIDVAEYSTVAIKVSAR